MSYRIDQNNINLYDLSKSKLIWQSKNNSYGIWDIESICYVYKKSTLIDRFVSIGPMMAAKMYTKSNYFYNPEFIYRAVFGNDSVKFFRTHYPYKFEDTHEEIADKFKSVKYHLNDLSENELIELDISELAKIDVSIYKNIISEITFNYESLKIRILSKVKNINFNLDKNEFQSEIGEVVFPYFFSDSTSDLLPKSTFAYLAFNNLKKVEFVLEIINKKTGYKQFQKRFTTNSQIKLWSIN